MNFDPTDNESDTDITHPDSHVRWKFRELIKNLITLASPAERQFEIIGAGAVCDEMAIDFETYFSLSYQEYIDVHLLTVDQCEQLQVLDRYLSERSGDASPDFWDDALLATHPDWQIVREKSKTILELLGMEGITIEFDREEKYDTTDASKKLMIQTTKTRLVRNVMHN